MKDIAALETATTRRKQRPKGREPTATLILTCAALVLLSSFLVGRGFNLVRAVESEATSVVFWTLVLLVINLFPLPVAEMMLTLDMPILLAIGMLWPPELAAIVALVGAVDIRELVGHVSLRRAVFNRAQIALGVLLSSWAFHAISPGLEHYLPVALAAVSALLVFYLVNVVLVVSYTAIRLRSPVRQTLGQTFVGPWPEFLATYLGCGLLALVLAVLYREVGAWASVLFLLPLLIARQALARAQRLEVAAGKLKARQEMLRRLLGSITDEREDERLRIAGGLHDHVLQSLIRVAQLASFIRGVPPIGSEPRRDADELAELSKRTIEDLRQVISDMRRSPLGVGGVSSALENLCQDLQLEWATRIEAELDDVSEASVEIQLAAYQVAREALTNALKHAKASRVRVALKRDRERVTLRVEDDGVGLDSAALSREHHFGVRLMDERVRLQGGTLTISSSSEGASVEVSLPLARKKEDPD